MKGLLFVADSFNASLNPILANMFQGSIYLDGTTVDISNIEEGNIVVSDNLCRVSELLNPNHSDQIVIDEFNENEFLKEIIELCTWWIECKYSIEEIQLKINSFDNCSFYINNID